MNRTLSLLAVLSLSSLAAAEGPPKPGPEVKALAPLVGSFAMKGHAPAGALGPGTPEMPSTGKVVCGWTLDNFWLSCEVDETIGTGKDAWKMHIRFLAGWDRESSAYRAVGLDNTGTSTYFSGKLEGTAFTVEALGNYNWQGKPAKEKLTFDFTDPKSIRFDHQMSYSGAPYAPFEQAALVRR